jgi:two-component system, OmpR family, response regulator
MRLLYVDSDRELVDLLRLSLPRDGVEITTAHTAPDALAILRERAPDLVLLDVDLGAWNGLELLQVIRAHSTIPVVVLSTDPAPERRIRALELGADDYLTKPISYRELLLRLRIQYRHAQRSVDGHVAADLLAPRAGTGDSTGATAAPPAPPANAPNIINALGAFSGSGPLHLGPVTLDPRTYTVENAGQRVPLSPTEFRLLHYLMACADALVPTPAILAHVWSNRPTATPEVVRVTLYRLRKKLGDDPASPTLLHTVPGVGAMFRSPAASAPLSA